MFSMVGMRNLLREPEPHVQLVPQSGPTVLNQPDNSGEGFEVLGKNVRLKISLSIGLYRKTEPHEPSLT